LNSVEQSSRPDLYVVARIIKVLNDKNRINKTALATSTGLSYDKLMKYLDWMSCKGFVELDSSGCVCLTDRGRNAYAELVT
jgi:predicted transcriptional regulator